MAIDVLIIGQGLAGTALGWACQAAGLSFQVVDRGNAGSASAVSAGLMSPVDGRQLERSWRFGELLPRSLAFYHEVEDQLGETLLHPFRGWRLLQDEREAVEYQRVHRENGLAPFDQGALASEIGAPWLKIAHGGFAVSETYRLDVVRYLGESRARWLDEELMVVGEQLEHDLVRSAKGVVWRGDTYRTVVFCTGAALVSNTRLVGALEAVVGEISELEVESWPERTVVQCGNWFVPIGEKRVAVNACRDAPGTATPEQGKTESLSHVANAILKVGWKIDAVRSGVRVAARDRGPVAGLVKAGGVVGVMGGLGANGALWAPWLARQWVAWLTSGAAFDHAVDVNRLPEKAARALGKK